MRNKIQEAFDTVHAEASLKESTRQFLRERREAAPRRAHRRFGFRAVAAVACCLLLLFGAGGYSVYTTPVAAISIDVNPSIQLGINRFDRVVTVESYNQDGARVLEGLKLKNQTYTDAIDAITQSPELAPYLADGSLMVYTVAADSDQESAEILTTIQSGHHYDEQSTDFYSVHGSCVEEAHSSGMSIGKYRAYQELSSYDVPVTEEEACHMSIGELQNRIHACEEEHGSEEGHGSGEDRGSDRGDHHESGHDEDHDSGH